MGVTIEEALTVQQKLWNAKKEKTRRVREWYKQPNVDDICWWSSFWDIVNDGSRAWWLDCVIIRPTGKKGLDLNLKILAGPPQSNSGMSAWTPCVWHPCANCDFMHYLCCGKDEFSRLIKSTRHVSVYKFFAKTCAVNLKALRKWSLLFPKWNNLVSTFLCTCRRCISADKIKTSLCVFREKIVLRFSPRPILSSQNEMKRR